MMQLEGLMKMLKNHQASPRSTPNSSPRSTKSPPLPSQHQMSNPRSAPQTPMGAPTTPGGSVAGGVGASQAEREQLQHLQHQQIMGHPGRDQMPPDRGEGDRGMHLNNDLVGVGGDVRNAFGGSSNINMVVQNGTQQFIEYRILTTVRSVPPLDFEDDGEDESDGGWQQELQRRYAQEESFMAELRARQLPQGGQVDPPFQPYGYGGSAGQPFRVQPVHYPGHSQPGDGAEYDHHHQQQGGYAAAAFGQQGAQEQQDTPFGQPFIPERRCSQERRASQEQVKQYEIREEVSEEDQEERNHQMLQFEEALKQWLLNSNK
nr:unnamed protein product [Callosobruchus analis]